MRIFALSQIMLGLALAVGCGVAELPPSEQVPSESPRESTSGANERFTLVFDRPAAVGQRFRFDAHVVDESRMVVHESGEAPRAGTRRREARLVGDVEVLEVDEGGLASERRVTIERFTYVYAVDDQSSEVNLPAGSVVHIWEEPRRFALGDSGSPTPRDVAQALTFVIKNRILNTKDASSMFGSLTPRAVGEEWPARDVAATLRRQGLNVREGAGLVRLLRTELVDDVRATVVGVELQLAGGLAANVPADMEVQNERMTLQREITLPVDPTLQRLRHDTTVQLAVELTRPEDGQRTVSSAKTRSVITLSALP